MATTAVAMDTKIIEAFCQRWKVREFALFGSVLRSDFNDTSDLDIMVSFQQDAGWSLLDHVAMRDELILLFGRNVDLVTRNSITLSRNNLRRREILESAEVIYAAA